MNIVLGHWYRDCTSRAEGVAVSITTYLVGSDRVQLQPSVRDDGELPDTVWCEAELLEHLSDLDGRVRNVVEANLGHRTVVTGHIGGYREESPRR